ncbi:MAG: hypothetical protein M1819_000227 [Sarea resinae]|nr:MAG: hypothetical protein M1819_000227 [Sarea resinae]
MSREQYQVPTGNPFAQQSSFSGGAGSLQQEISSPIGYLCGECNSKVILKRGDPIRCKECGHRVLYKERTKRMVQFEAR